MGRKLSSFPLCRRGQKMVLSFCNYLHGGVRNKFNSAKQQKQDSHKWRCFYILMVFPPIATEEKYEYLIIGQANTFNPQQNSSLK